MAAEEMSGPVDFLILEFENDRMDGSAAAALMDLVDRGVVTILDLLIVRKEADGSLEVLELASLEDGALGGVAAFVGAQSGLVGEDDVHEAGTVLAPGTTGALLVYENTWARPFVTAAHAAGATVVGSGRIGAEAVNEALDRLDTTVG